MDPIIISLLAIATGAVIACGILSAIKVAWGWLTTDDDDDDEPDSPPAPVLQGTHTVTHNTFAGGGESTTDKWEFYGPAPLTPPHTPTPYSPEELRSFGGFNAPPKMDTPLSEIFADKNWSTLNWVSRMTAPAPDDPTAEDDDAPCVSVTDIADLVQALHDYNGGQRPLPTDNEIRQFAFVAWLWCARHPNQIYSEFPPHRGARPEPTVHFTKEP
jgi:hypothetical protein